MVQRSFALRLGKQETAYVMRANIILCSSEQRSHTWEKDSSKGKPPKQAPSDSNVTNERDVENWRICLQQCRDN